MKQATQAGIDICSDLYRRSSVLKLRSRVMALLTLIIVAGDLDFSEDGHERLGLKRRPTLSRVVLMTFTGGMWFKWDCEHNEKNMYLDFFRLSFRDFADCKRFLSICHLIVNAKLLLILLFIQKKIADLVRMQWTSWYLGFAEKDNFVTVMASVV